MLFFFQSFIQDCLLLINYVENIKFLNFIACLQQSGVIEFECADLFG